MQYDVKQAHINASGIMVPYATRIKGISFTGSTSAGTVALFDTTTATTLPLSFNFTGNTDVFTATSASFKFEIYKYNNDIEGEGIILSKYSNIIDGEKIDKYAIIKFGNYILEEKDYDEQYIYSLDDIISIAKEKIEYIEEFIEKEKNVSYVNNKIKNYIHEIDFLDSYIEKKFYKLILEYKDKIESGVDELLAYDDFTYYF
jgi:hypothetical protein